jgi:hypothetical protein
LLLLDATHIAKGAVNENHRHQRNSVAYSGGKFVAGI